MTDAFSTTAERPVFPALKRGWRRRCPKCGQGPILSGYLKLRESCPVCRENLSHARADDGPAYITILLTAHVMGPLLLLAFEVFRPDPLILAVVFSIGVTCMSLFLLPRVKGALVGIQWAKRMHGF